MTESHRNLDCGVNSSDDDDDEVTFRRSSRSASVEMAEIGNEVEV